MTDPHLTTVFVVVGLFSLSMISPGPNFVMIVRSSLLGGRAAGVATAFGVVAGNTFYASVGLLGLAIIFPQGSWLLSALKIFGALYLVRLGLGMMLQGVTSASTEAASMPPLSQGGCFRAGLLTDLANPQSLAFFTGIAAASALPDTPLWVPLTTLVSIAGVSSLWRVGLALFFSTPHALKAYFRLSRYGNPVIGMMLLLLAGGLLMRG